MAPDKEAFTDFKGFDKVNWSIFILVLSGKMEAASLSGRFDVSMPRSK